MAAKGKAVNARRFYASALNEAETSELPAALEVEGVDDEIALLRLRLRTALEDHPEDMPLMFRGVELLARLVATRYRLTKDEKGELDTALMDGLQQQLKKLRSEKKAS